MDPKNFSDDLLILTDKNDSDKTKTSSVADFQKFFGVSTVDITITAPSKMTIDRDGYADLHILF